MKKEKNFPQIPIDYFLHLLYNMLCYISMSYNV